MNLVNLINVVKVIMFRLDLIDNFIKECECILFLICKIFLIYE